MSARRLRKVYSCSLCVLEAGKLTTVPDGYDFASRTCVICGNSASDADPSGIDLIRRQLQPIFDAQNLLARTIRASECKCIIEHVEILRKTALDTDQSAGAENALQDIIAYLEGRMRSYES